MQRGFSSTLALLEMLYQSSQLRGGVFVIEIVVVLCRFIIARTKSEAWGAEILLPIDKERERERKRKKKRTDNSTVSAKR